MITLSPKQRFFVFCLELFRAKQEISGKVALSVFNDKKLFNYLENGFEVLHTQGENYILADILDFLKQRE